MSINAFKASLVGGGARPNQFRVRLALPSFIAGGAVASKNGEFLCEATSLPGSSIGVAPAYYRGRVVPFAGERTFQPWTVTIVNDTTFDIYNALEQWVHYMNHVSENTGETRPLNYTSDMGVDHLDRNGIKIKDYNFISAFPTEVSPISLAFNDNDNIERFTATFQYSYWTTASLGNK